MRCGWRAGRGRLGRERPSQKLLQVFRAGLAHGRSSCAKGSQTLSPEAEIGLVGELTLLRSIIDAGVPLASARSLGGTARRPAGLRTGHRLVEVKATPRLRASPPGSARSSSSTTPCANRSSWPAFACAKARRTEPAGARGRDARCRRGRTRARAPAQRAADRCGLFRSPRGPVCPPLHGRLIPELLEVKDGFSRLTPCSVPLGVVGATGEIDLDKAAGPSIPAAEALKSWE